MTIAHEMPKLYTAIAEWLVLPATVWLCRGVRARGRWLWVCAAALPVLCAVQLPCGPRFSLLWLAGMAVSACVMGTALYFSLHLEVREAAYLCARAFLVAEFAAALEWELDYFYHFDEVSHLSSLLFCVGFCAMTIALCAAVEYRSLPAFARGSVQTVSPRQLAVTVGIAISFFALADFSYLGLYLPFTGKGEHEVFNIRMLMDFSGVVTSFAFNICRIEEIAIREQLVLQQQMKSQYEHYLQAQEVRELVHHKYHDLRHMLGVLRAGVDAPERLRLLDEFEDGLSAYQTVYETGSAVLDCILSDYAARCLEKQITLVAAADGEALERLLQTADICTVFGNALENAVAYEETVPEVQSRRIRVEVAGVYDFLRILVENDFEGTLEMKGGLPRSTKDGTLHGYGLKSVRCVVEKYGGAMNIQAGDGAFRLRILLPYEDNKEERTTA